MALKPLLKKLEKADKAQQEIQQHEARRSKFQAPIARVSRGQIKNAEYNPRKITKHAAKKLEHSLRKKGLVSTLTWNRQTGNLVGGHQRLAILDALHGSPDYTIDVSVVDLPPKDEAELCVQLNSPGSQGEYDPEKFRELFESFPDLDSVDLGMDQMDLEILFQGMDVDVATLAQKEEPKEPESVKETLNELERINALKRRKQEYKGDVRKDDDPRFFTIIVFDNNDEREKFLQFIEQPAQTKYLDARTMCDNLGIELTPKDEPAQTDLLNG